MNLVNWSRFFQSFFPLFRKMLSLNPFAPSLILSPHHHLSLHPPFSTLITLQIHNYTKPNSILCRANVNKSETTKTHKLKSHFEEEEEEDGGDKEVYEEGDGFSERSPFGGREEERDYDKDPEFADILGTCLEDPQKAQSKMEDRLRKKRNKILHTKTGSATPMNVTFNKFDFSNSYIWFEFYNDPLQKDVSLICDTIRSWHIIGRLGGCNSMNMQLSQSPLEKRPNYDAIEGANVTPTTFYNIGDLEIQDNLARIWIDVGTSEPLLLDILINALTQISSDYVGIKQVMFGGSEFENWREDLTTEDAGYYVHKI